MSKKNLIQKIKTLPNCTVYPAKELPKIESKHSLPADLKEFYELCGGVTLFDNGSYVANIVPPEGVVLANPVIEGRKGTRTLLLLHCKTRQYPRGRVKLKLNLFHLMKLEA